MEDSMGVTKEDKMGSIKAEAMGSSKATMMDPLKVLMRVSLKELNLGCLMDQHLDQYWVLKMVNNLAEMKAPH